MTHHSFNRTDEGRILDEAVMRPAAQHATVALVLLAWALQAASIWSRHYLPLIDLPNHMARHYYESLWLRGAEVPPWYRIDYRLLPNLGGDLIIPFLLLFLTPMVAAKLFLTLAAFAYWLGAWAFIRRATGPSSGALPAATLLLPFVIDGSVYWGFLNYYSGLGVALFALAYQDWILRRDRATGLHLFLHSGLVTLLFLWHLAPWFIYGSLAACRLGLDALRLARKGPAPEGSARPGLHRLVLLGLTVLPSVFLFYLYKASPSDGTAVNLSLVIRPLWTEIPRKLFVLLSLVRSYDWRLSLAVIALWAAALSCWFWPVELAGLRRNPTPLIGLVFVLVIYIILPEVLGTISPADARLVPAVFLCGLACLGTSPVHRPVLGSLLLGLCLVVRFVEIDRSWSRLDAELTAYSQAFRLFPPGSRILPVNLPRSVTSKEQVGYHFHLWAVVESAALDPGISQLAGQFPIQGTMPAACRPKVDPSNLSAAELGRCYDYLWLMDCTGVQTRPPEGFRPVFSRGSLTVYRICPESAERP